MLPNADRRTVRQATTNIAADDKAARLHEATDDRIPMILAYGASLLPTIQLSQGFLHEIRWRNAFLLPATGRAQDCFDPKKVLRQMAQPLVIQPFLRR